MNCPNHTVEYRSCLKAILGVLCVVAIAVGGGLSSRAQIHVSVDNRPASVGSPVSVPVRLGRGTNVVAAQFDVTYDRARVIAGTPTRGGQVNGQVVRSRQIAPGVVRLLSYSMNNTVIGPSNVMVASIPVTLTANDRLGSGPITPTNILLARRDATRAQPVGAVSGSLFLAPITLGADRAAHFFLEVDPDGRYLIQASSNLVNWTTIATNLATGSFLELFDQDAALYPQRFYRAKSTDDNTAASAPIASLSISVAAGQSTLRISGFGGKSYELQASSNLIHWETIATTNGFVEFTDAVDPKPPTRFFRVRTTP